MMNEYFIFFSLDSKIQMNTDSPYAETPLTRRLSSFSSLNFHDSISVTSEVRQLLPKSSSEIIGKGTLSMKSSERGFIGK